MKVLENRKEKAYAFLKEAGFSKVILGEPMSIYYLTGIHVVPYERFYALILDVENQVATMINPSVDTGCMNGTIPEVTYQDSDGPEAALKQVVGGIGKLGVETKYFSMAVGEVFGKLGCPVSDIGDSIAKLRMYKDEEEIKTMQKAADIVDEAIAYISDKIKPGMTEKEVKMMLFTYMSDYPGFITDEFIILVLSAANSANPHGVSGDNVIQKGDILLMDFCAYYNYYWSDITRCLFIGEKVNPKLKEIYEIVLEANLAAIAAVKPGVAAKEIDKAARDVIEKAGYGPYFLHRTGHGLGISVHEEPYITSVSELILEEGMTFTIEPGIYLEGIGGVRIEDDILVTQNGCHIFTATSKKLEDHIITC